MTEMGELSTTASASGVDCDEEHIFCVRRCYAVRAPWPFRNGTGAHRAWCRTECLKEYMECVAEQAVERAFEGIRDAVDWLARHPEVVVGTLVVVGGVIFVVATGGSGGLILVAL